MFRCTITSCLLFFLSLIHFATASWQMTAPLLGNHERVVTYSDLFNCDDFP